MVHRKLRMKCQCQQATFAIITDSVCNVQKVTSTQAAIFINNFYGTGLLYYK